MSEVNETAPTGMSEADAAKIGAAIAGPLAAALKEALAPAPVVETKAEAPASPAETTEEMVTRLLAEQKAELTAAFVKENGLPKRTGIQTAEGAPDKPLHELSLKEVHHAMVPLVESVFPELRK